MNYKVKTEKIVRFTMSVKEAAVLRNELNSLDVDLTENTADFSALLFDAIYEAENS